MPSQINRLLRILFWLLAPIVLRYAMAVHRVNQITPGDLTAPTAYVGDLGNDEIVLQAGKMRDGPRTWSMAAMLRKLPIGSHVIYSGEANGEVVLRCRELVYFASWPRQLCVVACGLWAAYFLFPFRASGRPPKRWRLAVFLLVWTELFILSVYPDGYADMTSLLRAPTDCMQLLLTFFTVTEGVVATPDSQSQVDILLSGASH